jgi:hypothetical protein
MQAGNINSFSQRRFPVTVKFKNLEELYQSEGFDMFISNRLGNDLFINDPDRAKRCYEAAEFGADGSTHQEHIEDWRAYLGTFRTWDAQYDETEEDGDLSQELYDAILKEIDDCEEWHHKNGSLFQEIG